MSEHAKTGTSDSACLDAFAEIFGYHRDQKGQRLRDQWLAYYGIWSMAWREAEKFSEAARASRSPMHTEANHA